MLHLSLFNDSDLLSLSLYYAAVDDHMMLTFLLELGAESVDIVSMVFVLSAIHPQKHKQVSPCLLTLTSSIFYFYLE